MPTCYTSLTAFQNSAIGYDLASYSASKPAGAIDRAIFESSAVVSRHCGRELLASPTTTVGGSGATSVGSLTILLGAAVNIHQMDVLVFPHTGEVVEVAGCSINDPATTPYPGVAQLVTPTANIYNPGDAVQVYRQERYTVRGRRTGGAGDSIVAQSQSGQMAQMHAPKGGAGSSRLIFLRQYPVLALFACYESLPWSNTETAVDLSSSYLNREEGWYRLPVGFFNPVATIWRTQYRAGYGVIPDDVQDAVHNLVAERLVRGQNPIGATAFRQDVQSFTNPGLQYRQRAYEILEAGCYVRQGML